MDSSNHTRHRSGWLKQENKAHKQKKSSKREIDKALGGRVERGASVAASTGGSSLASLGRQDRANRSVLLRKNKRQAVLAARRKGGSCFGGKTGGAPRTIGVIYLSEQGSLPGILGDSCSSLEAGLESVTEVFSKENFRATFLVAGRNNLSVLDVAKVSDVLCFVLPLCLGQDPRTFGTRKGGALDAFFGNAVDEMGRQYISIAKAQGLPATMGILQNLDQVPTKYRSSLKKHAQNFFIEEFGEGTKLVVDTPTKDGMADADSSNATNARSQFIRMLMEIKLKHVSWRSERSYMLGMSASINRSEDSEEGKGTLAVSGYLRGRPLDVHQLVHIPGHGSYRIAKIEGPRDPHPLRKMKGTEETRTLATADPSKWASLEEEASPDMMAGEQTWPTEEEMAEEEGSEEKSDGKKKKKLPPGTSDYQAAWLDGISDDEGDSDNEEDEEDMDDASEPEGLEDGKSIFGLDHSQGMTLEEWKKKKKEEQDEVEFPDEVETPIDVPAKDRFGKYRGLKSFRTSPWHAKELLPREYARIFQVKNPGELEKQVLQAGDELEQKYLRSLQGGDSSESKGTMDVEDDGVVAVNPGQYVTIYLVNVPLTILEKLGDARLPCILGSLMDHEQKLSVLNCNIQKVPSYEKPVKARDVVLMSCGIWRREVRPAYSENNANCDKNKFERYLHAGRWSVATAYAPLTFGANVPVLLLNATSHELVANGSVKDINPDRIILKKVVLSGYPVRVKKSWAVVRYMFFSPEDVRWFKPVDIWTKYGMSGRILEPVGTHGLFKCSFSKPIKNNDTICMSLYKRVYPKPVHEFKDLQKSEEDEQ